MKISAVALLYTVFAVASSVAQPPSIKKTPPTEAKSEQNDQPKSEGSVFAVVCDGKPGQMIILDSNGKWVPNVKNIEIKAEIGNQAVITCTIYEGVLKPTRPNVKSWTLSQMKTVTNSEFQKLVDSLQSDPEAIKSMLKD